MPAKSTFFSECSIAFLTGERFFSGVLAHVVTQNAFRNVIFRAYGAGIWFVARVQSLMPRQRSFVDESPSALFTFERLLAFVDAHMIREMTGCLEACRTLCARVRSFAGVHPSMVIQVGTLRESFPALITDVWFFAGVNAHVNLEGGIPKKLQRTFRASDIFLASRLLRLVSCFVGTHVHIQTGSRDEDRKTFRTREIISGVSASMVFELTRERE